MRKEYKMLLILIGIVVMAITLKLSEIAIDRYNRERCYNMPINQYVEDKACEKYTFEEYMEEHYGS